MTQSNAQRAFDHDDSCSPARRPVDTVRHGNVEIAIWKNTGSNGDFFSASTPTIRYNDNGEWKNGSSFSRHDLLDLAEASREAAMKVRDRQHSRSQVPSS
jgi:hypothetical protein